MDRISRVLRHSSKVLAYMDRADLHLRRIGYTEHSQRHAMLVATRGSALARDLALENEIQTLAWVAGYLHDLGNMLGRFGHGPHGALLVRPILEEAGLKDIQAARVMEAIANHEEESGQPTDTVAAFLVLADKSDVHRSRVLDKDPANLAADIHDRVNYAATQSHLGLSEEGHIRLSVDIDETISSPFEYFEIFSTRMLLCRKAASILGQEFHLYINHQRML